MNIDKIKVGDKFSTENKLLTALGYSKSSGNTRLAQLKEVKQYFEYTRTGKQSRGKQTSEIIITKKYIAPLDKDDKRLSEIHKYLKPLILSIPDTPKSLGHKKILLDELKIINKEKWKEYKGNNKIEFYKYYLLNDFKSKLQTSFKQLLRENENFYYEYNYMLINLEENSFILASRQQREYINSMKSNIKDRIIAKHKLEHPNEKNKTWRQLTYRYTTILYKMVNEECKATFNMDKCVEVVTIENENNNCELVGLDNVTYIQNYYKDKMWNWIKKNKYQNDKDIVGFHNNIF